MKPQDKFIEWNSSMAQRQGSESSVSMGSSILQEILRRDWMFKLVGKESFQLGPMKCIISVEALGTFAYEYSLEVNGKNYEKFREEQSKKLLCWETHIGGEETRIVLG
ncbi:unnamed protein product [Haemonchus placei]|uniref:Ovule protein n=1 Tax=Haemonchus placei TaxID=6290 RepID=A0A0N4XBV4_HAEPC|nr:unnamed protein product [Haemonchus placei]